MTKVSFGKKFNPTTIILGGVIILLLTILGYGWQEYSKIKQSLAETQAQVAKQAQVLVAAQEENQNLTEALANEQGKNSLFEQQINQIASTVGNLDKLSRTDPELLQKYSKVYFLSENYVPAELEEIPSEYLYDQSRVLQFQAKAWPFLADLLEAAIADGIDLKIISAYRSFGTQSVLKTGYSVTYGAGTANQFSADQGYSEHQLGTTIDFTTSETGANFNEFKNTTTYDWLLANAYKYGFVLSYPENNTFYQFEPWHWRFVGQSLALRLNEAREHFYDLSQREISDYLISIFD